MNNQTFFGFKSVDTDKKQTLVNEVFHSVASNYDKMNDIMSFGIHRIWKNIMIDEISSFSGNFIDVAGGTGDIASRIYKKCRTQNLPYNITLLDINPDMLKVGKNKLLDNAMLRNLNFICGNAEELPFSNDNFDYYTCAFGIRNFTNIDKALKEAYRVLKPGGKFICLEFSHISNDIFSRFYDCYSMQIIPIFGKYIAKDQKAYQYLVESIKKFPTQNEFCDLIKTAGFTKIRYQNLTGGICAIHTAIK